MYSSHHPKDPRSPHFRRTAVEVYIAAAGRNCYALALILLFLVPALLACGPAGAPSGSSPHPTPTLIPIAALKIYASKISEDVREAYQRASTGQGTAEDRESWNTWAANQMRIEEQAAKVTPTPVYALALAAGAIRVSAADLSFSGDDSYAVLAVDCPSPRLLRVTTDAADWYFPMSDRPLPKSRDPEQRPQSCNDAYLQSIGNPVVMLLYYQSDGRLRFQLDSRERIGGGGSLDPGVDVWVVRLKPWYEPPRTSPWPDFGIPLTESSNWGTWGDPKEGRVPSLSGENLAESVHWEGDTFIIETRRETLYLDIPYRGPASYVQGRHDRAVRHIVEGTLLQPCFTGMAIGYNVKPGPERVGIDINVGCPASLGGPHGIHLTVRQAVRVPK